MTELRDLVRGIPAKGADGRARDVRADGNARVDAEGGDRAARDAEGGDRAARDADMLALPLPEIAAAAERRFGAAAADRDADAMAGVVLELETAIGQWQADTDEDQGTEQARALLRSLIGRLGRAAQRGLAGPGDRLAPAVEPLLVLRARLRGEGNYAAADAIREALAAAGLDVSDTPEGTRWQPTETAGPPSA